MEPLKGHYDDDDGGGQCAFTQITNSDDCANVVHNQ